MARLVRLTGDNESGFEMMRPVSSVYEILICSEWLRTLHLNYPVYARSHLLNKGGVSNF